MGVPPTCTASRSLQHIPDLVLPSLISRQCGKGCLTVARGHLSVVQARLRSRKQASATGASVPTLSFVESGIRSIRLIREVLATQKSKNFQKIFYRLADARIPPKPLGHIRPYRRLLTRRDRCCIAPATTSREQLELLATVRLQTHADARVTRRRRSLTVHTRRAQVHRAAARVPILCFFLGFFGLYPYRWCFFAA